MGSWRNRKCITRFPWAIKNWNSHFKGKSWITSMCSCKRRWQKIERHLVRFHLGIYSKTRTCWGRKIWKKFPNILRHKIDPLAMEERTHSQSTSKPKWTWCLHELFFNKAGEHLLLGDDTDEFGKRTITIGTLSTMKYFSETAGINVDCIYI